MKFLSRIAASIGLTLVLATVSFAQHVKTDYDHNANFANTRPTLGRRSRRKTSSWSMNQECGKQRPGGKGLDGSSVGR